MGHTGFCKADVVPAQRAAIGTQHGRLTVLATLTERGGLLHCRCVCGVILPVKRAQLLSGNTKSCGCLAAETARERFTTHGEVSHASGKRVASAEYRAWQNMRNRCLNPKTADYRYYGGRGISIDPSWSKFENFLRDMGRRPTPEHTVDRRNGALGYSKKNCRWATRQQQAQNRKYCKLDAETANEIRALYVTGKYRQKDLAVMYGSTQSGVSQIIRRVAWA